MSRRVWFARDAGFTSDPKIQTLGLDFGPAGPLVVEELLALAKLCEDEGQVTATYKVLGARAFVTPVKAKAILVAADQVGAIEAVAFEAHWFTTRFPRWARWQVKDPTAAARKSRQRHASVTA